MTRKVFRFFLFFYFSLNVKKLRPYSTFFVRLAYDDGAGFVNSIHIRRVVRYSPVSFLFFCSRTRKYLQAVRSIISDIEK